MVGQDFVRRCRVPRLDHAVVPGNHDERDAGSQEPIERFEYRGIGPGFRFDDIKEVACVDEHVGFLVDNLIYRFEEIVIDLLFPEVHAALGVEAIERG